MYDVYLKIGNQEYPIHNHSVKLLKGTIKQGINCIDSFSFEILPNNIGFNKIHDFTTMISVVNTKRSIYEFQGRVLCSSPSMSDTGLISKSVICESFLGFLQDAEQDYVYERNWTPTELLTHLLNVHNDSLSDEPYKQFKVGTVFSNKNIYIGIQRESTWECINKKIIEKIGGEIQLRIEDDGMYIDIVEERGSRKTTEIALGKNMKSITKENDPSSYITRLIPLGAKITDENGNETEERVDISSVNDGLRYIQDDNAIQRYGLHIKHVYWDDVHDAAILKTKSINFLSENNKVLQKYSITAVDLALLGIEYEYIDVGNYYPVKNHLINVDDTLRVINKTIDIVNETSSSFEIGDVFKMLSDLEIERDEHMNTVINTIEVIEKNYVTNQAITNVANTLTSLIDQTSEEIKSIVSSEYTSKSEFEQYQESVSTEFSQTKDSFQMTFTELIQSITDVDGKVNSNYEELVKYIRFSGGTITLGELNNPLTLTLDNDRLSFKQNGIEVAYVSNNKLYITEAEILYSLKIGKFAFIARDNGSLDFKKVGD